MSKTVLLFGYHSSEIARNWIVRKGLTEHGYSVQDCRTLKKGLVGKYIDLAKMYWKQRKSVDIIYVMFMGYYFMPLAWVLAKITRKKLVFDGLISMHENEVHDRKNMSNLHPFAWFLFFLDWWCYRFADLTLLECPLYAGYLSKKYHVSQKKFLALPVGCRTDVFYPAKTKQENKKFRVMYQGTFIPLHGVDIIIQAAAILQNLQNDDIHFDFYGKGQMCNAAVQQAESLGLTNVDFHGFLPSVEDVAEALRHADVGMGMFADVPKVDRVMPHKVYEVLHSKVALITAKTSASDLMFEGKDIAKFVPMGDSQALAEAIVELHDSAELKDAYAKKGYEYAQQHFLPRSIVEPLVQFLDQRK